MAKVQRVPVGKVAPRSTRPQLQPSSNGSALYLPSEPNEPPDSLSAYTCLVYGSKGIGKSSLAAQNPGSLTFMFEPRRRNLRIRQLPNDHQPEELTWSLFKDYLQLVADDSSVQTVIVDSADIAYDLCRSYVCQQLGVTHFADLGQNSVKGWHQLAEEFETTMKTVAYLGKGLWFTSHARQHTIDEVVAVNKFMAVQPTCPPACFKFLKQLCDFIFYYGHYDKQRTIFVRSDGQLEAASGLDEKFLDPDGVQISAFYAGNSAAEAFDNLNRAFNNELRDVNYVPPKPEGAAPTATRRTRR